VGSELEVDWCSYLLIGFWYAEEKNGYAARKAFIVTPLVTPQWPSAYSCSFRFQHLNIQEIATQAHSTGSRSETALIISLIIRRSRWPIGTISIANRMPDAWLAISCQSLIHAAT